MNKSSIFSTKLGGKVPLEYVVFVERIWYTCCLTRIELQVICSLTLSIPVLSMARCRCVPTPPSHHPCLDPLQYVTTQSVISTVSTGDVIGTGDSSDDKEAARSIECIHRIVTDTKAVVLNSLLIVGSSRDPSTCPFDW